MNADREFWRRQPLLFGQVREDSEVERWLGRGHGAVGRAMVVASAGDTALALASLVGARLDAVDLNPVQAALTEIKIAALRRLGREAVVALFSGRSTRPDARGLAPLSPIAAECLARLPAVFPRGLMNVGRVDRLLAVLRRLLFGAVHSRRFVENFLRESSPARQAERFDREWDTLRWRLATDLAFNAAGLRLAFGPLGPARLPSTFAAHLRRKIRDGLIRFPAVENGCAWQSLLGEFPPGIDAALPAHLRHDEFPAVVAAADKIRPHVADVACWLDAQPERAVDFFALSNILELSGAASSRDLLARTSRVAAPGAVVCLRGILPLAGMPPTVGRLRLDEALSSECARRDRSLICNEFAVYRAGGV